MKKLEQKRFFYIEVNSRYRINEHRVLHEKNPEMKIPGKALKPRTYIFVIIFFEKTPRERFLKAFCGYRKNNVLGITLLFSSCISVAFSYIQSSVFREPLQFKPQGFKVFISTPCILAVVDCDVIGLMILSTLLLGVYKILPSNKPPRIMGKIRVV